jgi:hypothetical protein
MLVVRCTLSNFYDKLCQLVTPMAFSESSKNKKRRPDITEKLDQIIGSVDSMIGIISAKAA